MKNFDDLEAAYLSAGIDLHIPIIDLHLAGDLETALERLDRELDRLARAKVRYCRVVHGIGTGVLALVVHKNLAKNRQILGFREEESGGSCLVIF